LKASDSFFYLLFTGTILALFFTHPFLVYPFDIYTHLGWIDTQNLENATPLPRESWHFIWAHIFDFLSIPKNKIFLRASIIHYTQFITIFAIIFYVSRVILKILFHKISFTILNYLSYWSTLIWFTIFSTFSVHYQQVWIIWYSVNYQITLPFTLLLLGLTLSIVFEPLSRIHKSFYLLTIFLLSYVIMKVHAMEYIYFLMYLGVLLLIHSDKIFTYLRKNLLISFGLVILLGLIIVKIFPFIRNYSYRESSLFNYLSIEKLPQLLLEIQKQGEIVLTHYNKASTTINELMILSLFLIAFFILLFFYRRYKKYPLLINIRVALFLCITSLFILIPLFTYSAGLASILTYNTVSYRFYYSSLIFLILPSFVFYFLSSIKIKYTFLLNFVMALILLSTLYYSKNLSEHANYYKNIHSIKDMFSKEKMSFNLNQEHIITVGEILNNYEHNNTYIKPLYYYARDDIAFVIRFIYQKPVFYQRRGTKNYKKSYRQDTNTSHKAILFETPKSFPNYQRFY